MEPRLKVLFERPIELATSSRERDLLFVSYLSQQAHSVGKILNQYRFNVDSNVQWEFGNLYK